MSINNHKLTKKLQVLLTENEVSEVNRLILNDAIENQTRPISISSFIRELIQREIKNKSVEQISIIKKHINQLKQN
jgi:regulator of PEP synthase PpsR (kinase-PPPase family)